MKFKALILAVALGACSQIDDNEIGLKRIQGQIQEQPVRGLVWYNFLTTDIVTFDNRQAPVEQDITTPTFDQQRAHIAYKATVQLSQSAAARMYRQVGEDWVNSIVPQLLKSTVVGELGKHTAVDVVQKQSEVENGIKQRLVERLRQRGVILSDFQITGVKFSDQYMNAVESKATAIQTAEAERNKTASIREQATQRIITAEAEAKAMQVQAAALSANKGLTEYKAVQKWDGHLPQYMMGNSTPFINVNK